MKYKTIAALERYFDVTLTPVAERHPFHYAGVNDAGHVDLFILLAAPKDGVVCIDVTLLGQSHIISEVTGKHCVLAVPTANGVAIEFIEMIPRDRFPILPSHPSGALMPVVCIPVASLREVGP